MSSNLQSEVSASYVPSGYTIGTLPDGQRYLTPTFMVPALDQELESKAKKEELNVGQASSGVSFSVLGWHQP